MVEVKDEILASEPSFRITDKDGNIIFDEISIDMITKVLQIGTPLNKVLFDSIKNDIDNLGAFEYSENLVLQGTAPQASWNTWATMEKFEPIKIALPENRRFLFISGKGITVNYSSPVSHSFFILIDTVEKKIYDLYKSTDKLIAGDGISETNPSLYTLEAFSSIKPALVLAITNYNFETKELTVVPAVYNSTSNNLTIPTWEAIFTVSEPLSKGV